MRCVVAIVAAAVAGAAAAQDTPDADAPAYRQNEAHIHGRAVLTAAAEDGALVVELVSPGYNLVGFERAPATPEEEAAVTAALARLQDADATVMLDPRGRCTPRAVTLAAGVLAGDGHGDDHDHADHDHGEHEHDHDDHAADDHDHGDESHHASADVTVRYEFACARLERLAWMDVELFAPFARLERVEAAYLDATRQTAAVLTPGAERFDLQP